MNLNITNRIKKFTQDFKEYYNHLNYSDLQKLYVDGTIKTTAGIANILEI